MKNLEYEDGTPSRTWVDDDYNENHLNDKQKGLVNRYADYKVIAATAILLGQKNKVDKFTEKLAEIEKELGL